MKALIQFMEGSTASYLITDQLPSFSFLSKKVVKNLGDFRQKRGKYRGRGGYQNQRFQPYQNFTPRKYQNNSNMEGLLGQLLGMQGGTSSSGYQNQGKPYQPRGGGGNGGGMNYGIQAQKKVSRCAHCDQPGHWVGFS